VVVELLLRRDELLAVTRRQEEAAAGPVPEQLDGQAGQPVRLLEPAYVAARDMELEQAVGDICIVV
jgi:hypothetical protein